MHLDNAARQALPVCSILLGFLFAGFWWTLSRVLFKAEDRHFKLGIGLLLVAMVMLAVFGVVLPMRAIAYANPGFLQDYRGVVLALITVFGYMVTGAGSLSWRGTMKFCLRSCHKRGASAEWNARV